MRTISTMANTCINKMNKYKTPLPTHNEGAEFEQSPTTDLSLVVENKKLFVNKGLLMIASPVFAKMFTTAFKEKDASEIDLPGKKARDVVAFLRCIYPDIMDEIDDTNVYQVLHLADEYQCQKLRQKCENYLVNLMSRTTTLKPAMHSLSASCTYGLQRLLEASTDVLSDRTISTLKKHWHVIPAEGRLMVCMKRIEKLETAAVKIHNTCGCQRDTQCCKCGHIRGVIQIKDEFAEINKIT